VRRWHFLVPLAFVNVFLTQYRAEPPFAVVIGAQAVIVIAAASPSRSPPPDRTDHWWSSPVGAPPDRLTDW
jgi:hypothetical protein